MKYDFESTPPRLGTDSVKWDVKDGELPMWVADMDYEVAPEIKKALVARVNHGVFGYSKSDEEFKKAVKDFHHDLYGWDFEEGDVLFSLGVVSSLYAAVRAFTKVGDNVVIMPPVYHLFYNTAVKRYRNPLEVPLLFDGKQYQFDWKGLEEAFALKGTSLCLLCNPGNPVARIWSKEELYRLARLAKKYDVIIVSDEIHGPISRPGVPYVPFLSVDSFCEEVGFAAISASKAFNIAGIQGSSIVVKNPAFKEKLVHQLDYDLIDEPNVFSCLASKVAYSQGREWLKKMNEAVFANRDYATSYINKHVPGCKAIAGDATYLLWVDCSEVCLDSRTFLSFLREQTGLFVSPGEQFGKGGEGHFRLNLATDRKKVIDAMERLREGAIAFRKG